MRVISMQSPVVWDILKRDNIYTADLGLCREQVSYKEDIKQLGGSVPIWCWAYPDLGFVTLHNNQILEYLRCEMSLNQHNCWDHFVLLELEIPADKLLVGKHHNDCCWSKVTDKLTYDMVRSVNKVSDSSQYGWYFKTITPIYRLKDSIFPPDGIDCKYWDEHDDLAPSFVFNEGSKGKCLCCSKDTKHLYKGKHFCSLHCAFKLENRLIYRASRRGLDPYLIVEQFAKYDGSLMQEKFFSD